MSGRNRGGSRFSGGGGGGIGGGYGGAGSSTDNYRGGGFNNGGFNGNFGGGYNNYGNMANNLTNNDLMQLMSVMANNLNMNPDYQPNRMGCGELRPHNVGMLVRLTGRLIKKRVQRFAELRDRNGGACQLVILEDKFPRVARRMHKMPENTMLTIVGVVMKRPLHSCNQTMPTGDVEVEVQDILGLELPTGAKRAGDKRSYTTMTQPSITGITSTEYKLAKSENILKYFENRDITCNDLRREDIGKTISLVGWIASSKNTKFMQLKDGYGQTQIIIEDQALQDTCLSAPEQTVLQITGKVLARPRGNINLKYDTGEVEVLVENIKVLNPDEPYDGPIKVKEKVQKMSIDDIKDEEEGDEGDEVKNGASTEDCDNVVPTASIGNSSQQRAKVADTNKFTTRTHNCGELTIQDVGEKVVLFGWLEFQRMNKFLILRDGYGQTQVLITEKTKGSNNFPLETVLRVEGIVIPRPSSTINEKMSTGLIEIDATNIGVVNTCTKYLPFEIRKFNRAGERLRLAHRYLDLRFTDMQHNLRMRSAFTMRLREYLINYLGFVEVETPTLFRRTPGGAQEFVVPTRKPGHFYSLVQSPQQFKQMLMVGSIDRYFQVARCYRDEATRPDRQPEFTQLDIELSFTSRDDILQLIEELMRYSWPKEFPKIQTPFKRITYQEAMEKYGTDKPDLRFGLPMVNVTELIEKSEKFQGKYENMAAYAIVVRGNESFWNGTARKHYEDVSKEFEGTLFVRKFLQYKDVLDRLTNFLTADVANKIIEKFDLEENDLMFLGIGEKIATQNLMGRIRIDYHNFLLENNKVKKNYENKFIWVIDFPMFERNPETNAWESVHHPFTAPHPDDLVTFLSTTDIGSIRSLAYDLVLNGQEVGGGSVRIHDENIQTFVLEQILRVPTDELQHLLTALGSGCPPHGGIALGLDRLVAIMCRARSIRDVIAFPKSLNGRDPLSNAPVPISEKERTLYHLAIVESTADNATTHEQEDDDPDNERKSPTPTPVETEITTNKCKDETVAPEDAMEVEENLPQVEKPRTLAKRGTKKN